MNVKVWRFGGPIKRAGIEDLYLERAVNGGLYNIIILTGVNCWVKNVQSYKTRKWHVRIESSYECEVIDSTFIDGWDHGGDASYGVGLFNKSTDNLIENNVFYRLRHSMIMEYGGTGNVFGYNYSKNPINENGDSTDWLMADVCLHGGHPYMNLFEGNIGAHFSPDNVLGGSSYNTFFRNHAERKSIPTVRYHLFAVDVQANNLYQNFVGNVLGISGDSGDLWRLGCDSDGSCNKDPRVEATILRHGNWESTTGKTSWDPSIPDRNLPASLYLTSKPSFFGNRPWPIIGPDLNPMVGDLPAKSRSNFPDTVTAPKGIKIIQ
jgi:hypothetical protein